MKPDNESLATPAASAHRAQQADMFEYLAQRRALQRLRRERQRRKARRARLKLRLGLLIYTDVDRDA